MTVEQARARYAEWAHVMRIRLQIAPVPISVRGWWEHDLGLHVDAASITYDLAVAASSRRAAPTWMAT